MSDSDLIDQFTAGKKWMAAKIRSEILYREYEGKTSREEDLDAIGTICAKEMRCD